MYLIQILLPVLDNQRHRFPAVLFERVEETLASRFGGFTAFDRNPAKGLSEVSAGHLQRDEIVIFEVMVNQLDRKWWTQYKAQLEQEFDQDEIVIRAHAIERI